MFSYLVRASVLCLVFFSFNTSATKTESEGNIKLNTTFNDVWYNPDTSGQGFFITVLPKANIVVLSYFTWDTDEADNLGDAHLGDPAQRWLLAVGPISGNSASLDITLATGGLFDDEKDVVETTDGAIALSFDDCNNGTVSYDILSIGRTGNIPITRVSGANLPACEADQASPLSIQKSDETAKSGVTLAEAENEAGFDTSFNDVWYYPETAGQGIFITALPDANLAILSYFTWDTDEAANLGEAHLGDPGQRWMLAIGPIDGNSSTMDITTVSGGLFDDPKDVVETNDGTIVLTFEDCNSGTVEYDITSINRQGSFPIQRVAGDNVEACEQARGRAEPWKYWVHEDVVGLDDWGEHDNTHADLVALYSKALPDQVDFRIDYMDMTNPSPSRTFVGLDFKNGGQTALTSGNANPSMDVGWDVLIEIDGQAISALDTSFNEIQGVLSEVVVDRYLDYVAFRLDKSAMDGWDGAPFSLQAKVTNVAGTSLIDAMDVTQSDSVTGRGILVIPIMNAHGHSGPSDISTYDGFFWSFFKRPGARGGWRYLLDAVEKYEVPIQLITTNLEQLPSIDQLRLTNRFKTLFDAGLLDAPATASYAWSMPWWSDQINRVGLEMNISAKQKMGFPLSDTVYPYEGLIRMQDIVNLKEMGFKAIWALDVYRSWFGGIDANDTYEEQLADLKSLRKPQLINGMTVFFDTMVNNYDGFVKDERWTDADSDVGSLFGLSEGTDRGLHSWLRRELLDMALEEDREQFFTFGTDLGFLAWIFEEEANNSFSWLGSHPWIEVATFSDIASRGWTPLQPELRNLEPGDLMVDYSNPDAQRFMYQPFFPWSYYGGTSTNSVEVDAVFDYVPILRGGQVIPSNMKLGDYKTQGTIIGDVVADIQAAPDSALRDIAWQMFFAMTSDITWRDQETGEMGEGAKYGSNFIGHVRKITAAAQWADRTARNQVPTSTSVEALDLDLDGEDEYTISNNQVFAVLENDGGHVEYAFAYHPQTGPIQVVAPSVQRRTIETQDVLYENGETASRLLNSGFSGIFSEFGNEGDLSQSEMTAFVSSSSVHFTTAQGEIEKAFSLSGDTLTASYTLDGVTSVQPLFCIATNVGALHERDWASGFRAIGTNGQNPGWESSHGGRVTVNVDEVQFNGMQSFLDSPAPIELRERDEQDSYPFGHWFPIPMGCIRTENLTSSQQFDISVRLQALSSNFQGQSAEVMESE